MGEALDVNSAVEALKALKQPVQESEPTETTDQTPEPVEQAEETPQEFGENLETEQPDVSRETLPDEGAESEAETYDLGADDLANLLGIEESRLFVNDEGKVSFRAKVGEESQDVNLENLINAYQGDANLTNRSKALAEMEKAKQAELQKYHQQSTEFAQQAAAILDAVKTEFLSPYSSEDLKTLREDDPAEYAARMEEIRQREARFQQVANEAVKLVEGSQNTVSEETQQQYATYLQGEREKTKTAVPEWDKVEQDVVNYASEIGFSNDEIGMIGDSRLQVLMFKAMMFDKGKTQAKKKLSKPIPKMTKGGKTPSKQELSLEQSQKLRNRLKETGDWKDAVELFKNRRK